MDSPTRKPYTSQLRSQQAESTRQRVLESAATCFADKGYGRTTMAEIAERAGVSAETVKAQAPKRELLFGAFEHTMVGHEQGAPLSESEPMLEIRSIEDNAIFLRRAVTFIATATGRAHALWRAMKNAADADPLVDDMMGELLERRRIDIEQATTVLAERGMITAGSRSIRGKAAAISFLLSPEGYEQLVVDSGWSEKRYVNWLVHMIERGILDQGSSPSGDNPTT